MSHSYATQLNRYHDSSIWQRFHYVANVAFELSAFCVNWYLTTNLDEVKSMESPQDIASYALVLALWTTFR